MREALLCSLKVLPACAMYVTLVMHQLAAEQTAS